MTDRTARCLLPDRDDYPDRDTPPEELGDEWRESETCNHAYCAEVAGYARDYDAERGHRESLELARTDLDMPYADDRQLDEAIYLRLK